MARKLTEQQTGTEPEATPAGPARLRTTGPSAVAASLTYATIWAPWRPMGPPTNATGRWGERPMRLLLNGTRSAEVPDKAEFISLPPPANQGRRKVSAQRSSRPYVGLRVPTGSIAASTGAVLGNICFTVSSCVRYRSASARSGEAPFKAGLVAIRQHLLFFQPVGKFLVPQCEYWRGEPPVGDDRLASTVHTKPRDPMDRLPDRNFRDLAQYILAATRRDYDWQHSAPRPGP